LYRWTSQSSLSHDIPTVMGLELAYSGARDFIGWEQAECLQAAVEVAKLRLAWRPERVRVVLLAESHVWTSRDELRSRVNQPDGKETGFARFVYCLGYGEPCLVKPEVRPNTGTSQFWILFHDTVYGPNTPHTPLMKSGEKDWHKRTQNKLNLLEKMQSAGIWLVDASITALVRNNTKLARGVNFRAVLRACWESHIGDVVCGCAPSAVLIVGKGVESAIGDRVRHDLGRGVEVGTINQPNAHMSGKAVTRNRCACFDLCRRHRA
jgi:hypothetical protein